jgi:hypothetical protein
MKIASFRTVTECNDFLKSLGCNETPDFEARHLFEFQDWTIFYDPNGLLD